MTKNVRPIPLRKDLPPEIAAIALPPEGGAPATVILNSSEADPGATYREFRLGVLIPALLGWIGERIAWLVRDHQIVTTAAASSLSAAALATSVQLTLDSKEIPLAQPPAITIVTIPPPTISQLTPTAGRSMSRPKPTPTRTSVPAVEEPPPARPKPTREPQPERTPGLTTHHSRQPTVGATASAEPITPPAQQQSAQPPDSLELPIPTLDLPDDVPVTVELPTAAPKDCAVGADLDPAPDLCVIS